MPHPPRFYEVFGANGIKGSSPLNHGELHLSCKRGASHTPPGRFPHASWRRSMDPTTTCCSNVACPARSHIGPGTMGIQACKERRCLCTPCRKTCSATTGTAFSQLRTTAENGRPLRWTPPKHHGRPLGARQRLVRAAARDHGSGRSYRGVQARR